MEIVFKVINFIILFGALAFICVKTGLLKNIFGKRRENVINELDEAEKMRDKAKTLNADIEKAKQLGEEKKAEIIKGAEVQADINAKAISEEGRLEAEGLIANAEKSEDQLREEMQGRVSTDAMQKVAEITGEVLRRGGFENAKQALNDKFIEQIKDLVSAMPSDILNMNELKKLDISISSAEPLSEEEMKKLTQIVIKLMKHLMKILIMKNLIMTKLKIKKLMKKSQLIKLKKLQLIKLQMF